ncbi:MULTISPECIES: hypothetical protein [Chelativorans]|jgi:hypothetical protein|uniref:hypothetical protein n=1 Tax=Chelativorans TaxID=449972 RepID=UPI00003A3148|nr:MULTISPECIES: hypothetical protein [Chelativorans]
MAFALESPAFHDSKQIPARDEEHISTPLSNAKIAEMPEQAKPNVIAESELAGTYQNA